MVEEDDLSKLKGLLRRARHQKGLTMPGLEQRAGASHTTASNALNGQSIPTEATLVALARALSMNADDLMDLRARAIVAIGRQASPVDLKRSSYEALQERTQVQVDGDRSQLSVARGLELSHAGRHEEAIPHFERALDILEKLVPQDASYRGARAMTQYLLGVAVTSSIDKELGQRYVVRGHLEFFELQQEDPERYLSEYIRMSWTLVRNMLDLRSENRELSPEELSIADFVANDVMEKVATRVLYDESETIDSARYVSDGHRWTRGLSRGRRDARFGTRRRGRRIDTQIVW